MKIFKHISKVRLQRIIFFLLVALAAVSYDALHEGSNEVVKNHSQQTSSHQVEATDMIFYNTISSFKIREGVDKFVSELTFTGSEDMFLTQYHNYRTFHLLKAVSINKRLPFILTSHFMKFNYCHHSSPDDTFLVA